MKEEIINKAIEGGYKKPSFVSGLNWAFIFTDSADDRKDGNIAQIFQDPAFWQALFKAIGLTTNTAYCPTCGLDRDFYYGKSMEQWKYHALKYFDLLLTQSPQEADTYLTGLIKK